MPTATAAPLLDAALRGVLVSLLLLLAVVLGRERPALAATRAFVLLALGLGVQVVSSAPAFEDAVPLAWQVPAVAVSVGNGVLFWAFAQAMFDDDFTLRPVHVIAWVLVASLAAFNCAVMARSASVFAPLTLGLQRAAPLVFAVLAALAAASHWRADLVERRRRLRLFVVVAGAGYSVVMVALRLVAATPRLPAPGATLDVAMLLGIVAVVAWRMVRLAGSDLFPLAPAATPVLVPAGPPRALPGRAPEAAPDPTPRTDPADDRLAISLQRAMTEGHAYRIENLGIAGLAAQLGVPEYRLRRLINQRLGHRNFNAYVNGFRLAEATAALADPARRELPVLTIALGAGFQSIGPFNRAFKAATGLTPTEFRRQKLAES